MATHDAWIGVSDHGGWAVLVTARRDGAVLDRRRIELVDDALPALPHHHEGQMLPITEAVALVDQVRACAERHAAIALDAVDAHVPHVRGIALRARQPLPPTIAERITDYRARNVADWVMYRDALAAAAETRGLAVRWFESKTVIEAAARALRVGDLNAYFAQLRKTMGRPWNNDHKLALAAAVLAANEQSPLP
jgi:hypothetical protein